MHTGMHRSISIFTSDFAGFAHIPSFPCHLSIHKRLDTIQTPRTRNTHNVDPKVLAGPAPVQPNDSLSPTPKSDSWRRTSRTDRHSEIYKGLLDCRAQWYTPVVPLQAESRRGLWQHGMACINSLCSSVLLEASGIQARLFHQPVWT